MIVPRLKNEPQNPNTLSFSRTLTVSAGEFTEKAVKLLGYFLPYGTFSAAESGQIEGILTDLPSEEYELTVKEGKVTAKYGDYLGLRNALSTFALSVKLRGDALVLPEFSAADAPACTFRGILLDPARGNPPFENFCNVLILAAKCKYNYFQFHIAEHQWLSVEMDCLPAEYRHPRCFTKAQIKELNGLCDVLGIEIIPDFDIPAHATRLVELFPEIACEPPEDAIPSKWVACTGSEKTYALYEKIIAEVLQLFPNGKFFHMCGDELEFAEKAHVRPNSLCHWTICRKCKEFRKKHGLRDRTEQYYYFVNRINRIVKGHGRRLMMSSDQIDCTRPAGIDLDVLMVFWRIAMPGRGPYDGCSFDGQLSLGYQVVNAYYPDTYIDEETYMNDETIRTWRWDERPKCAPEHKKQIVGGELNAWNYGDEDPHYAFNDRVLPTTVALMGDKLWNGDVLPYSAEYDEALNRTVFGAGTPEGLNIFPGIGARIPPRTAAWSYPDRVTCSNEEIERILKTLNEGRYLAGDSFRAGVYEKCLRYTLNNRKDGKK